MRPIDRLRRILYGRFEVAPYFVKRAARWRQYAREQEAEFTLASALRMPCSRCGGAREAVARYQWSATLFAGFTIGFADLLGLGTTGEAALDIRYAWPRFVTYHATCRRCWERTQSKHFFAGGLNVFSLIGALLGAIGLLGLPVLGPSIRGDEMWWFAPACAVGCICLIGFSIGYPLVKRLRASDDRSHLAKTPYYLKRCTMFDVA